MLVVTIELWPGGDATLKQTLGTARIGNTGDGTPDIGEYRAAIRHENMGARDWKRVKIAGFPRQKRNAWDLLFRVLRAAVGSRNPIRSGEEDLWTPSQMEVIARAAIEGKAPFSSHDSLSERIVNLLEMARAAAADGPSVASTETEAA